jgi:hypothetical protein
MFRQKLINQLSNPQADNQPLYGIYKDFSGGINTRVYARDVLANQAVTLDNWDISTPAALVKAPGSVLVGSLASLGHSVVGMHNFSIQGGTDQLLQYHNDKLYKWTGTGNWVLISTASLFSGATNVGFCQAKMSGISPDDIAIFYNGRNNVMALKSTGELLDLADGSTSPPLTDVMCWYANRVWGLKNDLLYFSDAYDSDYSTSFDRTTNSFRIPVGAERGLVPTRDMGIVVLGEKAVWSLAPSVVPAATDQPQPLILNVGCVSKRGWASVGDDIFFFAQDGLRALKRTVQDKLQQGANYPVSYLLKTDFENIAWAYADRISMKFFDNKLFIAVPTSSTAFDTWIYYPATNSFTKKTGLSPLCWETYKVSGEERLYYGRQSANKVFQANTGYTDEGSSEANGTAQTATLETKAEDFGQPMIYKVGGEIEIEAIADGDYELQVWARVDDSEYVQLGVSDLLSTTTVLPQTLPFNLQSAVIVRKKFHLDRLGRFRLIQIKVINSDTNASDIKIYNINITTFPEEYTNE